MWLIAWVLPINPIFSAFSRHILALPQVVSELRPTAIFFNTGMPRASTLRENYSDVYLECSSLLLSPPRIFSRCYHPALIFSWLPEPRCLRVGASPAVPVWVSP